MGSAFEPARRSASVACAGWRGIAAAIQTRTNAGAQRGARAGWPEAACPCLAAGDSRHCRSCAARALHRGGLCASHSRFRAACPRAPRPAWRIGRGIGAHPHCRGRQSAPWLAHTSPAHLFTSTCLREDKLGCNRTQAQSAGRKPDQTWSRCQKQTRQEQLTPSTHGPVRGCPQHEHLTKGERRTASAFRRKRAPEGSENRGGSFVTASFKVTCRGRGKRVVAHTMQHARAAHGQAWQRMR